MKPIKDRIFVTITDENELDCVLTGLDEVEHNCVDGDVIYEVKIIKKFRVSHKTIELNEIK